MSDLAPAELDRDPRRCPRCGTELLLQRLCPTCEVAWETVDAPSTKDGGRATSPDETSPAVAAKGVARGPGRRKQLDGGRPAKVGGGPSRGLTGALDRLDPLLRRASRWLPPVRMVWLLLGVLIAVGGGQSTADGILAWAELLTFLAILDLALQFGRFRKGLRFPDAALATGMFLVVILQPAALWPAPASATAVVGVPLLATAAASVVIRHLLRRRGRPWFNPTALGLTVGYLLFALPIPWAVGAWPAPHMASSKVAEVLLVLLLGLALTIRQRTAWRVPATFFALALPLELLAIGLRGGTAALSVPTVTTVLGAPVMLFVGLWMVQEPRTAPSSPRLMVRYGALLAALYVLLDVFWTLPDPTIAAFQSFSTIDPFLALLVGNLYAALSRSSPARGPVASGSKGDSSRAVSLRSGDSLPAS